MREVSKLKLFEGVYVIGLGSSSTEVGAKDMSTPYKPDVVGSKSKDMVGSSLGFFADSDHMDQIEA